MELSSNGALFIAQFEGFSAKPYVDPGTGGEPITIGYGTTMYPDGTKVKLTDAPIDKAKALACLLKHVKDKVSPVLAEMDLLQHQYDALCSFIYNVGTGGFNSSSLKRSIINKATCGEITANFAKWNKGGGKILAGLVKRRAAEANLFCTGKYI